MTIPNLFAEFAPGAGPMSEIGLTYLEVIGEVTSLATAPSSAALDITGDIDVRIEFELTPDWYQTQFGGSVTVAGKWEAPSDASWAVSVNGGTLLWAWSEDGSSVHVVAGGAPGTVLPWTTGRHAVRITLDVDNGLGGWTISWYVADSIEGPYTLLISEVNTTDGPTSIFNSNAIVSVGGLDFAGAVSAGRFYKMEVRDGIDGTVVANPDFTAEAAGTTSFADEAGNTWTVEPDASIVGFDWVDLSDRLLSAEWSYGREDDLEDFPPGEARITLKNDDRELDPDYAAGTWFGNLLPRVPFRLTSSSLSGSLPGTSGATFSTPDTASYNTADVDVRVKLAMNDWTPGGFGTWTAGQYPNVGGNNGWVVGISSTGFPTFTYTTDGTAATTRTSTVAPDVSDGEVTYLRWVFDSNNGAAGNDAIFYQSSDEGETWSELDTVTNAGTVTLFNSTADFTVGSTLVWAGRVYKVQLCNGIDGATLIDADFTGITPGATSFTDLDGRVWTVNGTASIDFDDTYSERVDQFYGFVEEGWSQVMRPPELSNCEIHLVDLVGVLTGYVLPDVMQYAVMSTNPLGYWILDGPRDTETVTDLGSGKNDGTVFSAGGIAFNERPIVTGGNTSALFTTESTLTVGQSPEMYGRVFMGRSPIVDLDDISSASVVASFLATDRGRLNFRTLFTQNNSSGTCLALEVSLTGELDYVWVEDNIGGTGYRWPGTVVDGTGHIAFGQANGIAVDSATLGTSGVPALIGGGNGVAISALPSDYSLDHFYGFIGQVALYDRLLNTNERSYLLEAHGRLNGQRSDEHIDWALDRLGVPLTHRNLDEGTVIMGPAQTRDVDALEWMRSVAHTEGGALYVDHRDGGKIRFTNRYWRFTSPRSTSSQVNFSDDPALTFFDAVRVEREALEILPNGISNVVNQIEVTWRDGAELVEDSASVSQYGPRSRQLDTQATTGGQARSSGEWVVARYKDPRSRVKRVMIYPGASRTAFRAALTLKVDDRASYRMHPQQVGSATELDVFLDGVSNSVMEGVNWQTVYTLAPVDTFTPWIWGVSAWDTETYWG